MTCGEIIRALECCGNQNYSCTDKLCKAKVMGEAVELIKRQQAEKEALIAGQETLQKCITEKNAEIEELREINKSIKDDRKYFFATTIKVFAEEFEKRCIDGGIYPAFVKSTLNAVKEELTEVNDGE